MDQKHHCQVLWAKNKYLVLSHSSNIYKEIREYLKQDQVEVSHVEDLIQQALVLPENRGQVSNAFSISGAISKSRRLQRKRRTLCCYLRSTSMAKLAKKI